MPRRLLLAAVFAFAFLPGARAAAAVDQTKTFPAVTVDQAPPLALDFSTAPWTGATLIDNLEVLTTRSAATRYPTVARVLFDKDYLYVAIEATQAGVPLTATQTTNNVGFGLDDFVGIGIDPTGNGGSYYFESTPHGVRYQQAYESVRYNPQWNALAKPTATGYEALLVIPLNVLRTPNGAVQRWRFNIVRHIAATSENETWAYDPLMSDAGGAAAFPVLTDARFWPYLDGVHVAGHAIRPKPRAEIYGLESFGSDRTQFQQALGNFAPEGARNYGVDVNVPLTSTLAFVGAVAPDFSNVEIDQQTISPQEFRRSLNEYRPFFSQGVNYFSPASQTGINEPPIQLFYSPSIGPFDRGTKLEGTYGLQQLGLLNVQGAGFNDTVFGLRHVLPDRTFSYSLDVVDAHHADGSKTAFPIADNDFSFDGEVAGRDLKSGFVYGVDYGAERSSLPGTTQRLAYKTEDFVDVHKANYEVFARYQDVGPMWNPIDGFTPLSDIRGPGAFIDLISNPSPKTPFKRVEFFLFGDRLVERSGAAHQSDFNPNLDVVFNDGLHLSGGTLLSSIRVYDDGLSFNGYPFNYVDGVSVPFNQGYFNFGYKDGSAAPYDASVLWGPFTTFNPDGTMRPTYLKTYTLTHSRPIGTRNTIALEYDGSLEDFPTSDPNVRNHDGQILRRVTFGQSFGNDSNLSVSLRSISGTGGFSVPGINLAASFHRRFGNDSELFINYGTPAANQTLQRVIVKYVLRLGSAAGT